MATFRKRKGKWNVRIRSNHHRTISKTFIQKEDAIKYARGCGLAGGSIPHQSYVPIIIHIGEKDELVAPYLNCIDPMGNDNLIIYKYPEAQHSFDVDIPGFKYEGVILATGRKFTNIGHKKSRDLSIKRTLKFLNDRLNK